MFQAGDGPSRMPNPGGMTDISRWRDGMPSLPPVANAKSPPTPDGAAERRMGPDPAHLPERNNYRLSVTGGGATLAPRLISGNPPGYGAVCPLVRRQSKSAPVAAR